MTDRWRVLFRARAVMFAVALIAAFVLAPAIAQAIVPPTTAYGYVYDWDTAEPVMGANVTFSHWDGDTYWESSASTDSNGYYSVALGSYTDYDIYISAPGYHEYYDWTAVDLFTANPIYDIYLEQLIPTVEGDVTYEASGDPYSNASVDGFQYVPAWNEWDIAAYGMMSDTNGHWVADLPTGVYRFYFDSGDPLYRSEWYDDAADIDSAKNVTVQTGSVVSGIDAALEFATPAISGAVYDPDMALGVDYVELDLMKWVEDPEFGGYWESCDWTWTDSFGDYTFFDVQADNEYTILCLAKDRASYWADTYYGDVTEEADAASFVYDGTWLTGMDINIMAAEVSVYGYTGNSGTWDAHPNVPVELYRTFDDGDSWEWWSSTISDWGGYYEFDNLPDGTYVVGYSGTQPVEDIDTGEIRWYTPYFYDGWATVQSADRITVPGSAGPCNVYLSPAPPQVEGTVTRSTGGNEGVEGLEVNLFGYIETDDAWETVAWGLTDLNGDYAIYGVSPGEYKLGTFGGLVEGGLDPCYEPAFWDGQDTLDTADLLTVDTDWYASQGPFDLTVDPSLPVVTGMLKNVQNEPLPGGLVTTWAQGYWGEGSAWEEITMAESGDNGAFEMYAPWWVDTPRSYVLSFDAGPDYFLEYYNNKRTPAEATPVTLNRGSTLSLGNIFLDAYQEKATRLAGASRYSTAVSIAKRMTNNYANVTDVILASGENRGAADPLAAAGLTWAYRGAPMVLASTASVPQETKDAIKQIVAVNGAVRLHVVGGAVAMPNARITEIKNALGADADLLETPLEDPTLRIAGANRYETAARIADEMRAARPDSPDLVLIANGAEEAKFVDALALSTIAAYRGAPILTVARTTVPPATLAEIAKLGVDPANIYVAGGPNAVDPAVLDQLDIVDGDWTEGGNRLAGLSRYTTATTIADWAIANGWLNENVCGIAASVPDALTGGAAVGWKGGPLLLTTTTSLQADTEDFLYMLAPSLYTGDGTPSNCFIFGGPNSISATTLSRIDYVLSHYDTGPTAQ